MLNRVYWFIGLALLFVVLVVGLQPILMPFLTAALLAYLMDPVVDIFEAKGVKRTGGVVIVFVGMTLVMLLLALLIVPLLGKQLFHFVQQIPDYIGLLQSQFLPLLQEATGIQLEGLPVGQLKKLLAEHWQQAGGVVTQLLTRATASTLSLFAWLANLVLIPVVTFYLLRDWDHLIQWIHDSLPRPWEQTVSRLARECDEVLSAFIRGQLLVMAALAGIYSIGLSIVGLDLALLLGSLAGLASVVPYLGGIVGIGSASVAAYLQFGELMPVIYVLLVFGVGQMLEGMLLTPMLVGDKIGLHPVAVIFAIMAGGQLAGFTGILLALPVAAVLKVFLHYLHDEYKGSVLYQE